MEILKFRIWNYKSIIDSGDCHPSTGITILAGKNESGKTSILEALEDFNHGVEIREKAIPIGKDKEKLIDKEMPKISVTFKVPISYINEIFEEIGFPAEGIKQDFLEITVEKTFPNDYELSDKSISKLGLSTEGSDENLDDEISSAFDEVKSLNSTHSEQLGAVPLPEITVADYESSKQEIENFRSQIEANLPNVPEAEREKLTDALNELISLCSRASQGATDVDKFVEEFMQYIPDLILFSSFNDIFPNVIPLGELEENQWIKDLGEISDLDVSIIKSGNEREKIQHNKELNIQLNEDYKRFWEQDLSSLVINWDNQNLFFWIEENGNFYEPEIRSQGKRWHLAFYVRVTARAREGSANIILIDEPGLYLHAKAQKDVLKNLEDAADEGGQVLFSTHSPYLLEADKLERIRLVQKFDELGTKIENKIHKVADKETLTPILTAIGLEMTNGISQLDRIKNIIVEGASDYYYLNALKQTCGKNDLNFVHGGGAGNMPKVGTILQGWGCKVIYLYDNDKGAKDAIKNINSEWVTTSEEVIAKIPIEGGSIEDIFSKSDFAKYVLRDSEVEIRGKNSKHAKEKIDKVLSAKLFLELNNKKKITLDEETVGKIETLFKILDEKFQN